MLQNSIENHHLIAVYMLQNNIENHHLIAVVTQGSSQIDKVQGSSHIINEFKPKWPMTYDIANRNNHTQPNIAKYRRESYNFQ